MAHVTVRPGTVGHNLGPRCASRARRVSLKPEPKRTCPVVTTHDKCAQISTSWACHDDHARALSTSDENEPLTRQSPRPPAFFGDDDEEERLTRVPPPAYSYPPDPRFEQPTPPAWQRAGLILIIFASIYFAIWLQDGHYHIGLVA